MMKNGPYSLENGEVHFTDSQGHLVVSFPDTEMLGVAFDDIEGILHKHGRETLVAKWADNARRTFLSAGFDEMVKEIVVVSFPATLETIKELNACIAISGRVKHVVKALENIANAGYPSSEVEPRVTYGVSDARRLPNPCFRDNARANAPR